MRRLLWFAGSFVVAFLVLTLKVGELAMMGEFDPMRHKIGNQIFWSLLFAAIMVGFNWRMLGED